VAFHHPFRWLKPTAIEKSINPNSLENQLFADSFENPSRGSDGDGAKVRWRDGAMERRCDGEMEYASGFIN
jgi:hypothetical protein